ncbi:MAG: 16S rRNA (cytidine(1402)-2'-O)-methyltransferase [Candidatus Omnitrophica bacterium]|nr:16S rRNA (cytidine(1402)-2'-O)-methyltransferase [Candidatus Omnitrophota bacterium]
MLYVIATPIGNLEDITIRALRVLRKVDIILAEDTRQARVLLSHYRIDKVAKSFYEHNEKRVTKKLLPLLKSGKDVALISNAGTPTISDPGYHLLRTCVEEKIPFTSIPGPSAVTNAIVLSGLPSDRFLFVGFLPFKKSKRKKELEILALVEATIVIFESPHRLIATVNQLKDYFKDKRIALVKEMTKIYEDTIRANMNDIERYIKSDCLKGEWVIVIDNRGNKS